jgi:hypothetical protein
VSRERLATSAIGKVSNSGGTPALQTSFANPDESE